MDKVSKSLIIQVYFITFDGGNKVESSGLLFDLHELFQFADSLPVRFVVL